MWADAPRGELVSYLRSKPKVKSVVVHHADVEIFPDVDTEIHFWPSYTYNPFRWTRLRVQAIPESGMNGFIEERGASDGLSESWAGLPHSFQSLHPRSSGLLSRRPGIGAGEKQSEYNLLRYEYFNHRSPWFCGLQSC